MIKNTSKQPVTIWWDGKSATIKPEESFDVRELDVIQSDVSAVEDRMVKKYAQIERTSEKPAGSSKSKSDAKRRAIQGAPDEEGGHNAAVKLAIEQGEKRLKALKEKKDAASKTEAAKISKQLKALKETLK